MKQREVDLFLTPTELASVLNVSVQGLYKQLKELDIQTRNTKGKHKIYPQEMRRFVELKGLSIPQEIIALHIVKGGVGKTTLVHSLAARSSVYGFRTLMVDLDQQANLTTSFGVYSESKKDPTLLDVLEGSLNG